MAPPRKHDTDRILDSARRIVLYDGPRAASVAAIARESNAPIGTLYHRFGSRDRILAAAWLRAVQRFQSGALEAVRLTDPVEAAVGMAVSQVSFAREQPEDARLLLALRRNDLLDADPDDSFRALLGMTNAPLEATLRRFADELRGRTDPRALDLITLAVVDLPNAAVRRHTREGGELPSWLEEEIATAVRKLLRP
ncbi:MAG TPA: TetR/AcrR family transcriptional regulator [Solirubrobacteraceae bacterium]|jgi:AcrR family transcriptional regulator|nr:TetR/AcrR family transcriptional regulator [Solirubrobacteraceae bacterium]